MAYVYSLTNPGGVQLTIFYVTHLSSAPTVRGPEPFGLSDISNRFLNNVSFKRALLGVLGKFSAIFLKTGPKIYF